MSDDDFVTKPARKSKRKKRSAPNSFSPQFEERKLLIQSPIKTNFVSDEKEKSEIMISSSQVKKEILETEKRFSSKSKPDLSPHLAVFSTTEDKIKDTNFPSNSIDTLVSHSSSDDVLQATKHCSTDSYDRECPLEGVKYNKLEDIKMATKILCDNVENQNLKQRSLLSSMKCIPEPKKEKNVEKCVRKGTPNKPAKTLSNDGLEKPKIVPVIKQLVKQAGSSQLDLGAMLGLKPREHATPEIKVGQDEQNKKQVPFYKWVKGTTFTVDGFNYGNIPKCTAYFLSHFHYDHYIGLTKKFDGVVYCSQVTGNYVTNILKVRPELVKVLEFDRSVYVQGVKVSSVEANHCPGSAMFLFESLKTGAILHTGDFRFDRSMLNHPLLVNKSFDVVYLDTTYFDPAYEFPPQRDVIEFMVEEVQKFTSDTLIVCGSYTIGKERLLEGIAGILCSKVHATQAKMNLINMQGNKELSSRLSKSINSRVHIVPMKDINPGNLAKLLARTSYTSIVGVKPTGWTHTERVGLRDIKASGSGAVRIYSLPYSEHSSYAELQDFISSINVKKIISTVLPRSLEKRQFMFDKIKEWTKS